MLLYILPILCLSSAYGVIGEKPVLQWPEWYSVQAIRISLTSGVIEDYKAWKSNTTSRVDYNKGAVKTIIFSYTDDYEYGVKYEIHPETTDDTFNVIKCKALSGTDYKNLELEEILPSADTNDFKLVGHESVDDEDTEKFFYREEKSVSDIRHTLWAKYDDGQQVWIPVKYEMFEYNSWLGSLSKHDIWDFYNYKIDIDDSAFSIKDYDCERVPEITSKTKNLIFIDPEKENHLDHVFKTFKTKFDRKYAHQREHAFRRAIFKNNLRLIVSTNLQNLGYKLTINQFVDRTPQEMKRYQGLQRRPEGKVGTVPFPYTETNIKDIANDLPPEYDLRILGYVSTIKNQEDCGSCWTYGTTAAVEGALARINEGRLMSLSNQALIDCAWPYGADGCDGGTDNAAYEWMMKYGLPTEVEYGPYLNRDGLCRIQNMTKLYPIRGYTDVTPYSIGALKVAVINHGPLSVSVHVTNTFMLYSGGIFYDTTCNAVELNHEVTLVGYGERDGETFWILKNSWGPTWGVDGYMLISSRDNNCGVATEPTYVVF